MPTWSSAGYDLERSDRGLYLLLDPDGPHRKWSDAARQAVKLDLVLDPSRFDERLRRVRENKHYGQPNLRCVATQALPDVTHAKAEHIEAAARHWLCNARGFDHAGLVDWLLVPEPAPSDWGALLTEAAEAARNFGR